jgi:hypothetical protein
MTITEEVKIDRSHVEKQVKDWKKRISDLYNAMKGWTKNTGYSIKIGGKVTMYEELMAQFYVPPVEIDTADIYSEEKIVLTIKPKGLWMIGANGRIDILSTVGSYMIVDTAEKFKASKWKLYNGDMRNGVDFTKQTFLELLKVSSMR